MLDTQFIEKLWRIIIWVIVTESILGMPKQILPIKKSDGALDFWLY